VKTFGSPQEFLEHHDPHAPGCLVLDVAMPGLNGLDLQQALAAKGTELPIIFLTGRGDIPMSVQAMKQGAVDFLTKPTNDEDLLAAIRAGIDRDTANRQIRAEFLKTRQQFAALTPREQEVLRHVIAGKLNKQVAAELGIVEKTIKVHRARIMKKMKVRSFAELVRVAEHAGIKPAPGAARAD
jgi:FixJ family two-component response regulator